tara:strand:+ start:1952 stop:2698 length:747 start_codon:yes stop_codon:yes gene_type:complete
MSQEKFEDELKGLLPNRTDSPSTSNEFENEMNALLKELHDKPNGNCFDSSVKFMEHAMEYDGKEYNSGCCLFLSMYAPVADRKKPGFHFAVAINTDKGPFIVDTNAYYLDDEGKARKGVVVSQENYINSMVSASKNINIRRFNFAIIQLNDEMFKIFNPGVIGISQLVCEHQKITLTNELLRRCMIALKAFYNKGIPENQIIEMVIFEVFRQTLFLKGDVRRALNNDSEDLDFAITIGHDYRTDIVTT